MNQRMKPVFADRERHRPERPEWCNLHHDRDNLEHHLDQMLQFDHQSGVMQAE